MTASNLISKSTFIIIVLVLITGTISLGENFAFASNGNDSEGTEVTGEEDNEKEGVEESSLENSGEEQNTNGDNEGSNTNNTEDNEELEQENVCSAVTTIGSMYIDENGCPVPCPTDSDTNLQNSNIPEGCPNPIEEGNLPDTPSSEEQLTTLGSNLDNTPGEAGGQAEICEDAKDNDNDGEPDERACVTASPIDTNLDEAPDSIDDTDGDRVIDPNDNCPLKPNSDQKDSNGNGVGDLCDTEMRDEDFVDSDNDFSYEIRDNCPGTFNPDQKDTDTDGVGDLCDPDPNVAEENTKELCIDGTDNDGDGVSDGHDTGCNQVLYEPYEYTCNDGIDNDADSLRDMQDPWDCHNADHDNYLDSEDNCPQVYNDQRDSDGDGKGDACDNDVDTDGDTIDDSNDNCPSKPNTNQADSNGNGVGDLCDTEMRDEDFVDSDNDFSYEIRDNCPGTFNPDQKDTDTDGVGDLCDSTSGPFIVR